MQHGRNGDKMRRTAKVSGDMAVERDGETGLSVWPDTDMSTS